MIREALLALSLTLAASTAALADSHTVKTEKSVKDIKTQRGHDGREHGRDHGDEGEDEDHGGWHDGDEPVVTPPTGGGGVSSVPEPESVALSLAGLAVVAWVAKRRKG